MIEIIGSMAAILTTSAFIPQAYKIYKTNDTQSISLVMFTVLNVGNSCWLLYGILTLQWPIIIANIVTLIFSGYIFWVKLKEVRSK
ncbi:MAG: SemiSWEET transporter [Cytophagales bacterium]